MISPLDLQRDSPYFDRNIPVMISNSPDDSKVSTLTFRIIPGVKQTKQSGLNEKIIHFEFADENDPYFIYVLDVGEQDFHHLKRDQSILVEFSVFPSKFIELIELCTSNSNGSSLSSTNIITNVPTSTSSLLVPSSSSSSSSSQMLSSSSSTENTNHNNNNNNTSHPPHSPSTSSSSQFSARLDEASGIFSIVEANMFKQLTHISLQLRPGNDTVIKSYLASRLHYTSTLARSLARELEVTQGSLVSEKVHRRNLVAEVQELRAHKETDMLSINSSHNEEVAMLRMQFMQDSEKLRINHEDLLKNMNIQLETIKIESSSKIASLEALLNEANQSRSEVQYTLKDQARTLATVTSERDKLMTDVEKLNEQRIASEELHLNLEKEVVRMSSKVESLQFQLEDKDELIAKTIALQRACEESKVNIEERLRFYIETNEALQERVREGSQEVIKGNQAIASQQQDIQQLRDKIRLKGEVIRRQELMVNDLRHKVADLDRQLLSTKDALTTTQQHSELLTHQVDEARNRLQESSKLVASNQEVIAYLNDELNKWQLGMSVGTGQIEYDYSAATIAKLSHIASASTSNATSSYLNNKHTPVSVKRYEKPFSVVSVSPDDNNNNNSYSNNYNNNKIGTKKTSPNNNTNIQSTSSYIDGTGKSRGGAADFITQRDTIPSIHARANTVINEEEILAPSEREYEEKYQSYNNKSNILNDNNNNDIDTARQEYLKGMKNLGISEDSFGAVDDWATLTGTGFTAMSGGSGDGSGGRNNSGGGGNTTALTRGGIRNINSGMNTNTNTTSVTMTISPKDYMPSSDYGADTGAGEGYSQSDLDLLEAMDYYSTGGSGTSGNKVNNNNSIPQQQSQYQQPHNYFTGVSNNINNIHNNNNNRGGGGSSGAVLLSSLRDGNLSRENRRQLLNADRPMYSWQNDDFLVSPVE